MQECDDGEHVYELDRHEIRGGVAVYIYRCTLCGHEAESRGRTETLPFEPPQRGIDADA